MSWSSVTSRTCCLFSAVSSQYQGQTKNRHTRINHTALVNTVDEEAEFRAGRMLDLLEAGITSSMAICATSTRGYQFGKSSLARADFFADD